jgi:acyl-CoA synthetase (AMP-forming)/AMP-acid ligase II
MTFNLADLFESVVDAVPDREAIVVGERRLGYAELDARANRLAHHLRERGIGRGDHVGLQLYNGSEYLEGMLAAYKLRAVPINVNYRYVEGELRYLFDDADLRALICHRSFAPRVAAVAGELPKLGVFVVVDDDSGADSNLAAASDYEQSLRDASPERDFGSRSSDDLYIVYTGGTTGMPKGVMWRHEDIFFAAMGGGDPMQSGNPIERPEELTERLGEQGLVALPTPPFMHAAAQWLAFNQFYAGGKVVIPEGGRFDPAHIWELVDREKVNMLVIVGDAMATPLADEIAAHPDAWDASALIVIASGGALFSPAVKARILELLPNRMIIDGLGSSETGTLGTKAELPGAASSAEPRFQLNDETQVLDDDLRPVAPGSGVMGSLARKRRVPIGYYNDSEKSKTTFVEIGGERWALPGDMATVEEDGSILLLGRGSISINTGGEKVFPEEVEAALKAHAKVLDALVVGVDDERWGQRVVALVQTRGNVELGGDDVKEFCRERLAAFKVPRDVVRIDEILRSPAGKADYPWAREVAGRALGER